MTSLKFGTSGLRGLVEDLEGAPSRRYTLAFLAVMRQRGAPGRLLVGRDLRASSPTIAAAVLAAAREAGFEPTDCGALPTPALALESLREGIAAVMITGSHIPEDRNGLKFYAPGGEITKADEAAILAALDGIVDAPGIGDVPPLDPADADGAALARYRERYVSAFGGDALAGLRIGIYQHSTVARDLLAEVVEALGGTALPFARSPSFVPVDTEAYRDEDRALLREQAAEGFDAVFSADGDADRPLLADERGEIVRGDVIGLLAGAFLGVDTLVTPVTSSSAIETSGLVGAVRRTRVGSPFVIAGIEAAIESGARGVAGFEANGGFIQGTDARIDGRRLPVLATRDALLPLLCVAVAARRAGVSVSALVAGLGIRACASHRLQNVPAERSAAFLSRLAADEAFRRTFLLPLGAPVAVDALDGVRVTLAGGDVVHFRASGNAPELRCYAEAPGEIEAAELVRWGLSLAEAHL